MRPLLCLKDLSVAYRQRSRLLPAVTQTSFCLNSGEILGITGESGAGKTSLALALAGLLDPTRVQIIGEIYFEGRDLVSLSERELCRVRGPGIGMIFQDPYGSLNPSMRIESQVAQALRLHRRLTRRQVRAQAKQELLRLGFEEQLLAARPYAHQLSGGLCQRAAIAAALACRPKLLIADEPTSALDLTTQAQLLTLLKAECQKGLALIFISHNLSLLSKMANKLMVMQQGRSVELGPAGEVLSRPTHPYAIQLISAWRHSLQRKGERHFVTA